MSAATRTKVRTALLQEALQDNDPKARNEVEAFLQASKGNPKMPVGHKPPHQMSFEEQRHLAKSILSNWYKNKNPSFSQQIEGKHKSIELSGMNARKKALEQFKLK